jgi:cytosine/adenosine deaminase-related metal-dependent hydrolase
VSSGGTDTELSDLVLRGGRILDPETGTDVIGDVSVSAGIITMVSGTGIAGRREIDVSGLVVAPGWIDLHSHTDSIAGHRLQAADGVTTVLDLEIGSSPVGIAYAAASAEGRPLNYGFSASWQQARMEAVAGVPAAGGIAAYLRDVGNAAWQGEASTHQVDALCELLRQDLAAGALGVGVAIGYAPGVAHEEYLTVASVAAECGVPMFTHARDLVEHVPEVPIDGAEEIVHAASSTGAHMHYCHINSTSRRAVDRVHDLVDGAVRAGARVTTEAYPYGAGMTGIGAAFLDPLRLGAWGIGPDAIVYAPTGERIADAARLRELRSRDPGGLAIIHFLDEERPSDRGFLDRALLHDSTIVGSDAMPLTWTDPSVDPYTWPLPASVAGHPRTAGTFSKVLRRYVRERGELSLLEAVRRCSLLPAQVLEGSVPAMRRKGRLRPGFDADLVVFDPETVSDQSTYSAPCRPSSGYEYVLVGGELVIADGALCTDSLPGRAIRR